MREVPGRSPAPLPRSRAPRRLGIACAVCTLATSPAFAQGLLGAPVELGDLRRTFERAYERQPRITDRAWTTAAAIDAEITASDNVQGLTTGGSGGDIITSITPSLSIQGESARLRGSLFYAPNLRMYARNANQNGVSQNLGGNGTLTIFEDVLTINASAYATDTSRAGGLGPGATQNLGRQDRLQSTSFSIGPQLTQRIGDYGRFDAGYTLSYLSQTGTNITQPTIFNTPVDNGVTITNSGYARFFSGEAFGRFSVNPSVTAVTYSGSGVLDGAYRYGQILGLGYAISRRITALAEIGHQNIYYAGTTPYRFDGITWSLGGRWNPDPDTTMTFTYGERDGGTNFFFDGSTAPTARTRVAARYTEGVSTGAEDFQNAVLGADFNAFGQPVDRASGTPLAVTNNFGGANGSAARVSNFSVSGSLLQDLNSYSVSVQYQQRRTVTSNTAGGPPLTTFVNGSLSWQRELGPGLRSNALVSYGVRDGSTTGAAPTATQETMSFSAGLYYTISETLSTRASYTYTRSTSNQAGYGYDSNLFTIGVRKGF